MGYTYSGSNTVGDVAWYNGNNIPSGVKPVGGKLPKGGARNERSKGAKIYYLTMSINKTQMTQMIRITEDEKICEHLFNPRHLRANMIFDQNFL